MISSVSNFSSNSVAILFGTSGATSTNSASAASKILADATGNTDDVFKAGNAIGNIIEIASRMKQDAASADEKVEVEEINLSNSERRNLSEFDGNQGWYGVNGTFTKTYHSNGDRTDTFVGSAQGKSDQAWRQVMINSMKADQSTPRNRAMLEAFENNTVQAIDIAGLGFKTGMTMTTDYFSDGSSRMSVNFDTSGADQFREQYTELRDGVLHDKATGKFALLGQNGSQFIYLTW